MSDRLAHSLTFVIFVAAGCTSSPDELVFSPTQQPFEGSGGGTVNTGGSGGTTHAGGSSANTGGHTSGNGGSGTGSGGMTHMGGAGGSGTGGTTSNTGGAGGSPIQDAGPDALADAAPVGCSLSTPPADHVYICYRADVNVPAGASKNGLKVLHFQVKDAQSAVATDCFDAEKKPACVALLPDSNPADDLFEGFLAMPPNWHDFIGTVHHVDADPAKSFWWGDVSNDAMGGKGQLQGSLYMIFPSGKGMPVTLAETTSNNPGNPNGPYRNFFFAQAL